MKKTILSTKRLIISLVAMLTTTVSASAMSYEQARNEALFLTDKMAYELNLTDAQYEAAYEINLDYLMAVTSRDDVFGSYWERRNLDLSYILYSWQWEAFRAATYFYRPLYWDAGYWHFRVYTRYPRRDYFYFGRPHFYATYRGGHSWHMNGGHSYYHGRVDHFRPAIPNNRSHYGMRDGFNHGDYRNHRSYNNGSSTRVTGGRNGSGHRYDSNRSLENNRSIERSYNNNRSTDRSFNNNRNTERSLNDNRTTERTERSFSDNRSTERSFGNSGSNMRSSGSSTPNRNFGSSGSNMRSSGSSTPSRNFGSSGSSMRSSGSSTPSRSFGSSGSSTRSSGSGARSNGGGHFGNGRR